MEGNMQKCYIVGGLGCSGKTTFASRIGNELKIPVFHADDVHVVVAKNLEINFTDLAELVWYESWDKPKVDLKKYSTVKEVFKESYLEFFNYIFPEQLIIESESLYWNDKEMEILREVMPNHEFRFINISVDYERWVKNYSIRRRTVDYVPQFRDEHEYYRILERYESRLPKNCLTISDINNFKCSPTGGTNYQKEDFSDPKWDVFQFPEDMKGKTFMDISCNTGWFCKKASERGAKVNGLDISWQVLDIAMDRNPDGEFCLSKIEDFVPKKKYDFVLCSSAFHYYHHREDVIKKISEMTDNFTLEAPMIDTDEELINYQGGDDNEFCSVVSRGLLLKWLNKYFTKVIKIGETLQPNSDNRPVYRCTK